MSDREPGNRTLSVLDELTLSSKSLQKKWKTDNRYPEASIQKFIRLNEKAFHFIGVSAQSLCTSQGVNLRLRASQYVGIVPLLSPKTGQPIESLVLTGRYGEDIAELMPIVGAFVQPEFCEELRLTSNDIASPPLFMTCMKYVEAYLEAKKCHWQRFVSHTLTQRFPSNSTLWERYAAKSYAPSEAFHYPNKPNTLTTQHDEWLQLQAVLSFAIRELASARTPMQTQMVMSQKVKFLRPQLPTHTDIPHHPLNVHHTDPVAIKRLKDLANAIILHANTTHCAWRMDYATFYERFVQYVFSLVAARKGLRTLRNPKIHISGPSLSWGLHHLEPDLVLQGTESQYVIDAKYKSHLYNIDARNPDDLKETFRQDLHQVLAYASFSTQPIKSAFLVYPASHFTCLTQSFLSPFNGCRCKVNLIGLPLKRAKLGETTSKLLTLFD